MTTKIPEGPMEAVGFALAHAVVVADPPQTLTPMLLIPQGEQVSIAAYPGIVAETLPIARAHRDAAANGKPWTLLLIDGRLGDMDAYIVDWTAADGKHGKVVVRWRASAGRGIELVAPVFISEGEGRLRRAGDEEQDSILRGMQLHDEAWMAVSTAAG